MKTPNPCMRDTDDYPCPVCCHCNHTCPPKQPKSAESNGLGMMVAVSIGLVLLFVALDDRPRQYQPSTIPATTRTSLQ